MSLRVFFLDSDGAGGAGGAGGGVGGAGDDARGCGIDVSTLRPGSVFEWCGTEAHHAVTVVNLGVGRRCELVDGKGTRVLAEIAGNAVGKKENTRVPVRVIDITREEAPAPHLVLVQALAKDGRDLQAVEMATELGVMDVYAWQAKRGQSVWGDAKKVEKGCAKWENIILKAVKQSRRTIKPVMRGVVDSKQLAQVISDAVGDGDVVIVAYENAVKPFSTAVTQVQEAKPAKVWVVVGPEGGIEDAEVRLFEDAGAQVVKMGPIIMRASSAGPTALAALAFSVGHWE